jgi:hypothetical protein
MNAMLWIILASVMSLLLGFYLLVFHSDYLWICLPIIFFILIIRNAERSPFKARILDENRLTLSTGGIDYGEEHYPADQLEAVAIYLYAFEDFQYRHEETTGGGQGDLTRADGDQNKISIRVHGTVMDFDFYLDDYSSFSMVRQVASDWLVEGINVVLKQPFNNDFILQEMNYYNTPSSS